MRPRQADADGIIRDVHYPARGAGWNPDRWRVFRPLVEKTDAG